MNRFKAVLCACALLPVVALANGPMAYGPRYAPFYPPAYTPPIVSFRAGPLSGFAFRNPGGLLLQLGLGLGVLAAEGVFEAEQPPPPQQPPPVYYYPYPVPAQPPPPPCCHTAPPCCSTAPPAVEQRFERALPKSGAFGGGFSLEPIAFGPIQARIRGTQANGTSWGAALQFDLGPRWALRVPFAAAQAGSGAFSYREATFAPGLIYRFRDNPDQGLVPYLGAGAKLGKLLFGRELLGLPPILDNDTPVEKLGVAPELWAGLEVHAARWLALNGSVVYSYLRLGDQDLHVLREQASVRISF